MGERKRCACWKYAVSVRAIRPRNSESGTWLDPHPWAEHLEREIVRWAEAIDLGLYFTPRPRTCYPCRIAWIPRVTSIPTAAVAFHELGHFFGNFQMGLKPHLETELDAWLWARARMLEMGVWTPEAFDTMRWGLNSHLQWALREYKDDGCSNKSHFRLPYLMNPFWELVGNPCPQGKTGEVHTHDTKLESLYFLDHSAMVGWSETQPSPEDPRLNAPFISFLIGLV